MGNYPGSQSELPLLVFQGGVAGWHGVGHVGLQDFTAGAQALGLLTLYSAESLLTHRTKAAWKAAAP